MKFISRIRNLQFQFRVLEYWANLTYIFYSASKLAESTPLVIQDQVLLSKPRKYRLRHQAFRFFKALVENNTLYVYLTVYLHISTNL